MGGLARLRESEERLVGVFSVANQAAAFEKTSRSSLSLRLFRRNRTSSSRSALVSPPSPLPASRPACLIHVPTVVAEDPNPRDSEAALRPLRAGATNCRLNSGVYGTVLSAIVSASIYYGEVSTKAGQLQISLVERAAARHPSMMCNAGSKSRDGGDWRLP